MIHPFVRLVVDQVPRLLGLMDRDPASPTYGCLDRSFWNYKFVTDFPDAQYQNGVWALALLYHAPFQGNIYQGDERLREWVLAGVEFWLRLQHRDGSFSEAYPNERGFVATAFTSYSVSEILLVGEPVLPPALRARLLEGLARSARWLLRHRSPFAANQEAAALAALQNLVLLADDRRLKASLDARLEAFLRSQCDEGWFPEYGGFDVGYSSVTLKYLVDYHRKTRDLRVVDPIRRLLSLLRHFVHPDGTSGGEYGSRNTTYFLPDGLLDEAFQDLAAPLLVRLFAGAERGMVKGPAGLDDRFLAMHFGAYVKTAAARLSLPGSTLEDPDYFRHYQRAGVVVWKSGPHAGIVSLAKGGALKLFRDDRLLLSDPGYVLRRANGIVESTAGEAIATRGSAEGEPHRVEIRVSGPWLRVRHGHVLAAWGIPLRIAHRTIFKVSLVARTLDYLFKRWFVFIQRPTRDRLERRVRFENGLIEVTDRLVLVRPDKVTALWGGVPHQVRYGAFSKYFSPADLGSVLRPLALGRPLGKELIVEKRLRMADDKLEVQVYGGGAQQEGQS